jgi:hypothetical protein
MKRIEVVPPIPWGVVMVYVAGAIAGGALGALARVSWEHRAEIYALMVGAGL